MRFVEAPDKLVHIVQYPERYEMLGVTWCGRMYTDGEPGIDALRLHLLGKLTEVPANCIKCISLHHP